jgi:hypothetical protein
MRWQTAASKIVWNLLLYGLSVVFSLAFVQHPIFYSMPPDMSQIVQKPTWLYFELGAIAFVYLKAFILVSMNAVVIQEKLMLLGRKR